MNAAKVVLILLDLVITAGFHMFIYIFVAPRHNINIGHHMLISIFGAVHHLFLSQTHQVFPTNRLDLGL